MASKTDDLPVFERPNMDFGYIEFLPDRAGFASSTADLGGAVLRRSKIFIAAVIKIAMSSVGAASNRALPAGKCIVDQALH
jgi:hypothetical protein